jgi:DNA recombination protein RmuC
MDTQILYIIIAALAGGFIIHLLLKQFSNSSDSQTLKELRNHELRLERTRQELQQLLTQQNELMRDQLNQTNKSIQQNFMISQKSISQTQKDTSDIITKVTEKLSIVEKTNSQVVDFAKQLESLEKILKNPKQRGILGEYFLESTLKNVLSPDTYEMQYKFKDGVIVDAVVFVKDKIVPIDSKFSLENYNRILESTSPEEKLVLEKEFLNDLKKRIEETSKYIRPDEGTMEFAFMFIPSEGIYYDLLVNKIGAIQSNTRDLLTYAFAEKKVIIVSPTSFLAYLQTVLQGLRALKIEESAQEIRKNVGKLVKHLQSYEEHFAKVGNNLQTTINFYNKAHKEFEKIDKDVMNINEEGLEISAEEVDSGN